MLTWILRPIATSYANFTCEKDFICSFVFIYDEEVTIRKRNYILGYFAAAEACNSLVFASSCSSEMSKCSSLVAFMVGSVLQSTAHEDLCFCLTGLYPFLI